VDGGVRTAARFPLMGACEGMSSTRGYNLIQFNSCGILFGSVTSAMMNRTIPARVISSKPDYYMLLRFQKAAVRGNYETGNQAFSMHLRFLTIRGTRTPVTSRLIGIRETFNSW